MPTNAKSRAARPKTTTRAKQSRARGADRRSFLGVEKVSTGIHGLDRVMGGGFPQGRPTLVCGSAGCGKTLLGMQFLIHGASIGEPGVAVTFEETADDLRKNVASLGVDLETLIRQKKLAIDHIHVDRSEILETGGYDLSGLFVRLDYAMKSVGAKRIVLDTLEVLFSGFTNPAVLRSEIERLFRWLKDRGITAVVTGERGDGTLTRAGLEEYVSDCVIVLDQRMTDQICTRRIRVVKYRGSSHGTNEYPFLIDDDGISVLPITGLTLDYPVSTQRVVTGIPALDEMLGGKGYFRGSSVLISGTAGTGKSSVLASFARACAERNEKVLYFALEEPSAQVTRNMRSIGIDLRPPIEKGTMKIIAARPTIFGLEQHLVAMHDAIEKFRPRAVIVDPISSLVEGSNFREVKSMLIRLFDYLKLRGILGLFTYLSTKHGLEETEVGVSSLIDTWIELRDQEHAGERNRAMYILKSRGMPHSNQVREFVISSKGLDLIDAYVGASGVVVGSARMTEAADAEALQADRREAAARRERAFQRKRTIVEAQIEALRGELAADHDELDAASTVHAHAERTLAERTERMRQSKLGSAVRRDRGRANP